MTLPIALDTNLLVLEWVLRGAYRLERGAR
jgi:hypothetical protein